MFNSWDLPFFFQVKPVVERAIVDMSLTEKAGAVSKTYSGGNKRKLSIAMSMVANPKVAMLRTHARTHTSHQVD
jgi:ABC-type multidrug transport system ATPase subunit